jgi:hypothetical protein
MYFVHVQIEHSFSLFAYLTTSSGTPVMVALCDSVDEVEHTELLTEAHPSRCEQYRFAGLDAVAHPENRRSARLSTLLQAP